jgi:antitoxin (DNA-binding transcriptional repressor) of toxin-antitoxin stability system
MKQVGLYEAKSKLSALVSALIESGDPVSLTKHGQVVAELRLPKSGQHEHRGLLHRTGL